MRNPYGFFSCKDKESPDRNIAESATAKAGNATKEDNKNFQEQKNDSGTKILVEPVKMEIINTELLSFTKMESFMTQCM